eukprot:SAG31_NODE_1889_length_6986_cov_3.253666_4_plen_104_part_00
MTYLYPCTAGTMHGYTPCRPLNPPGRAMRHAGAWPRQRAAVGIIDQARIAQRDIVGGRYWSRDTVCRTADTLTCLVAASGSTADAARHRGRSAAGQPARSMAS